MSQRDEDRERSPEANTDPWDDLESPISRPAPPLHPMGTGSPPRYGIATLAFVLFALSLAVRFSWLGYGSAWSIFFHGLPAILAIALALWGPRGSLTGRVMLGTTFALLLSGTIAGEGFICVVLAAPFVYFIVWLVSGIHAELKSRRSGLLLPAVLMASLMSGLATAPPDVATATIRVDAPSAVVHARLADTPSIPPVEQGLLSLGFPQVVYASGSGLQPGDIRLVEFSDGGTLTMVVADAAANSATFEMIDDTTTIGDWVRWHRATVSWRASGATTEVSLSLSYERMLQPGWYFGPIIDAGVDLATNHLVKSLVGA